jgi:hypothetical protein
MIQNLQIHRWKKAKDYKNIILKIIQYMV